MCYSLDFRRKVLTIRKQENLSMAKVALRFGISTSAVMRWTKRLKAKTKRLKPATHIDMELLKTDVRAHPDAYVHERAKRLGASYTGTYHALKRLGVTYKKSAESSKSERRRTATLPKNP
jgi:transposase